MAKEKKAPQKRGPKKKNIKDPIEIVFDDSQKTGMVYATSETSPNEEDNNRVESPAASYERKISVAGIASTTLKDFSFTRPIYLQLHTGNIYGIFGSALITPVKYLSNRAFYDPQSLAEDCLVFSNGILTDKSDSLILLEISIPTNEQEQFAIHDGVAFFPKPIPISRIKQIHVSNEKVKKDIVITAMSGDGGIIPEKLISPSLPSDIPFVEFIKTTSLSNNVDYSIQIKNYDRILGSLAFLKNYSFLLSNKFEFISTFPDHFLFAVQALNNSPELKIVKNDRVLSFYRQLFQLQNGIENPLLKWLFERIRRDKNFTDEDISEFGILMMNSSKSEEFQNSIGNILNSLSKSLERKNVIRKISNETFSDKFSLYLFAFLRTYGNVNTEEKSISRADLPELVSLSLGEYVFAILGYFYGYKTLRNYDDKIIIRDTVFINNIDLPKRLAIKFDLNTLLDFVIIESVYSNVFIKISDQVETAFLASASIKTEWVKKVNRLPVDYSAMDTMILGKYFYQIKKKSLFDELVEIITKLPMQIPAVSEIGVYCFRNGITVHYSNLGDLINRKTRLASFIFFKRDEIFEAAKNNKLNTKELLQRIELSITYKEL